MPNTGKTSTKSSLEPIKEAEKSGYVGGEEGQGGQDTILREA